LVARTHSAVRAGESPSPLPGFTRVAYGGGAQEARRKTCAAA